MEPLEREVARQELRDRIKLEHARLVLGEISLLDYRASQEEIRIGLHELELDAIRSQTEISAD